MSVLHMDCRDGMAMFPDNTFDSIVCDPPYELTGARPGGRSPATEGKVMKGFMGMAWDGSGIAFDVDMWREAMRVLKPGGHLLAFSGSRTYHRMACAIEDAGFEIRDQIMWVYGSGFPKSRNLDGEWEGWGTALKPAHEPICVARKPLVGTVAANVLAHGTGALNIDGCRVGTTREVPASLSKCKTPNGVFGDYGGGAEKELDPNMGRWPANIIHDGSDEVIAAFPDAPGQQGATTDRQQGAVYGVVSAGKAGIEPRVDLDKSAARFFYCAKASKKDRGEGEQERPGRRQHAPDSKANGPDALSVPTSDTARRSGT